MIGDELISLAFGAFNILRLASYVPQIIAVARDAHGATSISFSCWTIWIGANISTALYAWVNVGDIGLAAVSAFNAACCFAVLFLAIYKRWSRYGVALWQLPIPGFRQVTSPPRSPPVARALPIDEMQSRG